MSSRLALLRAPLALFTFAVAASFAVAQSSPTWFKFQFGADHAAPGYTLVPATAAYSKEAGFGFEPGAAVTVAAQDAGEPLHRGAVVGSGTAPFSFSVAVPEGNYRVTVTLGDPKAEAMSTVKVETRRLVVEHVHTGAGQFVARTFTVNVRGPQISTGGEVNLDSRERNLTTGVVIARHWDDKLSIALSDTHPALAAIEITKVNDAVTFFITGDSTVTDQGGGGSSWVRWRRAGSIPRWRWRTTPSRARRSRVS